MMGDHILAGFLEYLLWCRHGVKVRLKLTQMTHYAMSKNQKSLVKILQKC